MNKIRRIRWLRIVLNSLCIGAGLSLFLAYLAPFVHPTPHSIVPFFGLAYPVIVLSFLALLLVQIFFNKWWALSMFVLLLCGGNLHFRSLTLGSDHAAEGQPTFRIMSFNVRLFDVYNPDQKIAQQTRKDIIAYLNREKPDIVCFQEFYCQDAPTNFSTKDTIIPVLGIKDYQERYAHSREGRRNFGIAIFTRFPIVEKGEIHFDLNPNSFNYAIYSDIVFQKDTIRIYNAHLQSIHLNSDETETLAQGDGEAGLGHVLRKIQKAYPERASQAIKLMQHIRQSPYPVVVCGDFNDTPMSFAYSQFNSVLIDAFRNCSSGFGKTYVGKIPAGRIDYIFHADQLQSTHFNIQKKALSDHLAIACDIFVKKK